MAKIRFENGTVVNFNGNPTAADIEEVATKIGIQKPSVSLSEQPSAETKPKRNFLQKAANFLGIEKFGQGIGQTISNISGTQDNLINVQNQGLSLTNDLVKRIKENKAAGKDTTRLQKALDLQLKNNKELASQIEGVGTGGLTNREFVGSALSTASMFIPGAPKGAGLLGKVGVGSVQGYAMDVGSKLQNDKLTLGEAFTPGIGTVVGGGLPIVSTIVGKAFKGIPKALEKQNLRLTPNEKRLIGSNKIDDVVSFNNKNNLIGSPEQRLSKVSSIVDSFERKVERQIAGQKVTFIKNQLKTQLKDIANNYSDDLSEAPNVTKKINSIIKQIDKVSGDTITASRLNKWKRNIWKAAFNKENGKVVNDALYEVGDVFKTTLDKSVKGLEKINKDYGIALLSKRLLNKATSRAQVGLVGKLSEAALGGTIGTAVGGPVGGIVGATAAPSIVSGLATPLRSTVGVGMKGTANIVNDITSKIPTDKLGNLQITKKALINLLQNSLE